MAFDTSHIENLPDGLDPELVKQAHRGKGWGAQDQRRYDKLKGTFIGQKAARDMTDGGVHEDYAALQAKKDSGAEFSDRANNIMRRKGERVQRIDARRAAKAKAKAAKGSSGQTQNPIDQTVTGETDSAPKNEDMNYAAVMPHDYREYNQANDTRIENTQEQNINQNNDIDTTVNGNDNTVINNQDNSVRQYGGDNRSFVYNSNGGGAGSDMPASMATLAGFFAPDDSPAAQAKFNDMYTTMNRDNQKRYAGSAMETFAKYKNVDPRSYTPESMANHIGRSTQYSFDRADRQTGHVFGDIWNKDYITEEWKMPTPPKAIESNADEIADKAKDDIEDI